MLVTRPMRTVGERQRLREKVSCQWPDRLGGVQLDLLAAPLALDANDLVPFDGEAVASLDMAAPAGVLVQEAEIPAHGVPAHGPADLDVAELGEAYRTKSRGHGG